MFMFFFAFGTIANFGILARERSQLMPYVFVLLSLTVMTRPDRRDAPRPAQPGSPKRSSRSSRPSGSSRPSR